MLNVEKKYTSREYKANEVVWFRKTNESFGGLSNMCSGYPLEINGHKILSSEALYQACRFPDLPEVQKLIINEKSPMTAKMKSKPHRIHTRKDWDNVRVAIMRWSLQVKLAQNFIKFGKLLEETYPKQIVEDSRKDKFWGAVREAQDENTLIGVNALGRLLMELRQKYMSENRYDLLLVEPLQIENFNLFGEKIPVIDERINFVNGLIKSWSLNKYFSIKQDKTIENISTFNIKNNISAINEPLFDFSPKETRKEAEVIKDNSIDEGLKEKIIRILKYGKAFTSKDLAKRAQVNWNAKQMTSYLKKLDEVQVVEGTPLKFKLSNSGSQNTLFL